jgi:hypothetical protein
MRGYLLRLGWWLIRRYDPERDAREAAKRDEECDAAYYRGVRVEEQRWQALPAIDATAPDVQRARALVAEMAPGPQSGEFKRHQVLARLMKEGVSESRAALLIELVIQDRKARV